MFGQPASLRLEYHRLRLLRIREILPELRDVVSQLQRGTVVGAKELCHALDDQQVSLDVIRGAAGALVAEGFLGRSRWFKFEVLAQNGQ